MMNLTLRIQQGVIQQDRAAPGPHNLLCQREHIRKKSAEYGAAYLQIESLPGRDQPAQTPEAVVAVIRQHPSIEQGQPRWTQGGSALYTGFRYFIRYFTGILSQVKNTELNSLLFFCGARHIVGRVVTGQATVHYQCSSKTF